MRTSYFQIPTSPSVSLPLIPRSFLSLSPAAHISGFLLPWSLGLCGLCESTGSLRTGEKCYNRAKTQKGASEISMKIYLQIFIRHSQTPQNFVFHPDFLNWNEIYLFFNSPLHFFPPKKNELWRYTLAPSHDFSPPLASHELFSGLIMHEAA